MILLVSFISVGYALRLRPTDRQTIGRVGQDDDIVHRVSIRVHPDKRLSSPFGVHPDKQLSRQSIEPTTACDNFSEFEGYAKFHEEGRQALARGEKRPVLTWTCGDRDLCGGNGDQLTGILSSLKIAMDTKRIFLLGKWSKSNVDISSFFRKSRINAFIDFHYSCTRTEHMRLIDVPFKTAAQNTNKSTAQCLDLNFNQGFWKRAEMHNSTSSGHRLGCLWNFMFQISGAGVHLVEPDLRSDQHQDLRSRNYLSMHLRFGDRHMLGQTHGDGRMNETSDVLKNALSCALNASVNSDGLVDVDYIELLTDSMRMKAVATNPEWLQQQFPEYFDHVTIDSTRDTHGNLTKPAHTDKGASRDGIYSAWRDQMIIAHSSRGVYSSGGFAIMASEIGLVPELWKFSGKTGECSKVL